MVIFDGAARSPAYFFNEKILCGLGAGFSETGRLNAQGKARAMVALKRFARLAEAAEVAPLLAVATAAVRDAEDGPEFRETVRRRDRPRDPRHRRHRRGAAVGAGRAAGLARRRGADLRHRRIVHGTGRAQGGGKVGRRATSDLGPLKLMGITGGKKALRAHIKAEVGELAEGFRRTLRPAVSGRRAHGGRSRGSTWNGAAIRSRCCTNTG